MPMPSPTAIDKARSVRAGAWRSEELPAGGGRRLDVEEPLYPDGGVVDAVYVPTVVGLVPSTFGTPGCVSVTVHASPPTVCELP